MIQRLIRKLYFEYLKIQVAPSQALNEIVSLESIKDRYNLQLVGLKDAYTRYIRTVSRPEMAVSLQLAAFSSAIFEERNCMKILDLGSGFSSLVSRRYGREVQASCWSVDDDAAWLQRTKDYLHQNQELDTQCLLLDDFVRSGENGFDAILLDLNFVEVRKNFIQLAVERCGAGGLILFDDVHKPEYLFEVLKQCRALSVSIYDISEFTRDQYGRYALLGMKN